MENLENIIPIEKYHTIENFSDLVGNRNVFGENGILYKMYKKNILRHIILWGPPGVGKTTTARLIKKLFNCNFIEKNSVNLSTKEIHSIAKEAKNLKKFNTKTVLFIDEIHRLSKSQQDSLLKYVEEEIFILVAATTENPSFYIISPLLSRSFVIKLKYPSKDEIQDFIKKFIKKIPMNFNINEKIIEKIAQYSIGDIRRVFRLLEIVLINDIKTEKEFEETITLIPNYQKTGDDHYELISAIQKSIRSSDVDATILWISKMLKSGEDPRYILRRLIRTAMEDIGLADPTAINIAINSYKAYEILGSPEGDIAIYFLAIYLALSPKSNSVESAQLKALEIIEKNPSIEIPLFLRNAPTKLLKDLGYKKDYKYDHNYPNFISDQKCLPEEFYNIELYIPKESGFEKKLKERKNIIDRIKGYNKYRNNLSK